MACDILQITQVAKAAIESEIANPNSRLGYIERVKVMKWKPGGEYPDIDRHGLILSPVSQQTMLDAFGGGGSRRNSCIYNIVMLCDAWDVEESLMATGEPPYNASGAPHDIGILQMHQDIFNFLYQNNLGGELEWTPDKEGYEALSDPIQFDLVTVPNRDNFLWEVPIIWNPWGRRWTQPP